MTPGKSFGGAQNAVLMAVVLLSAIGLGFLVFLLGQGAAAQAPLPTATSPEQAPEVVPTQAPSASPTHTPSASPSPTATPTVTPTLLAPLTCLPEEAERVEASVNAVVGASVIQVREGNRRYFVRYLGVDPAGDGYAAAEFNRQLVEGRVVTLIGDGPDADEQGNLLRYVLAGDVFVNFEIVRQGLALVSLNPPPAACQGVLLAGEELARRARLGYWGVADGTPFAPFATSAVPPCDCNIRYTCAEFASQSAAQACYNACGDYRNASLDPDHNGLACDE